MESEQTLVTCFEQRVEQYASKLVLQTKEGQLTYAELNHAANRVARAILAACQDRAAPMALLLDIAAPLFAVTLGGLKAGKISVPLSPALPPARLSAILEDAQAGLIVTNTKHLSLARSLAQHGEQLLNIDTLDSRLCTENLGLPLLPDTLAWILLYFWLNRTTQGRHPESSEHAALLWGLDQYSAHLRR